MALSDSEGPGASSAEPSGLALELQSASAIQDVPIGDPAVLALGESFVGEGLQVAVYGNASPIVKDLGTGKWLGIGVAEGLVGGALGISVPGGMLGSVAEGMVEVPVVEKIRRKRAKQQVGVGALRGIVGLYCTSSEFCLADLRYNSKRRTAPQLVRIALRTPLASVVTATALQNGGLDWLRIQVDALEAPLAFSTRIGTNHFYDVATWITAEQGHRGE